MKSFLEKPFVVNGMKSWIHCMKCYEHKSKTSPTNPHYHDYIELLYAFDANAYVWFNGEKHSFKTGDLAVINSNMPHTLTFDETSTYLVVKFLPKILYADENSPFEFKNVLPFLIEGSREKIFSKEKLDDINLDDLAHEILTEWESQAPAYEFIIRANILKIFASIFRYWHSNNIPISETKISDTIKVALNYIDENLGTVTEKDVAKHCNVSYNHFSFLFKKNMGKSFSEYISFLRLRKAEKLLLSTEKSIIEIASIAGFSTTSYFISKFKKQHGMTPRQFRERATTQHADLPQQERNSV